MDFSRAVISVSICFASLLSYANAQAIPHDLKTWTLEYTVDGGIRPLHRALTLTQSGDLTVSNLEGRISGHASSELMAKIADFLKVAKLARPSTPGPDQRYASLTLTSTGVKHELEVPNHIGDLLFQAMDTTLKKAFVGTWWESEWEFCHPAAQLTAEQMDSPIESVVFQPDGRFSVTWRGGGAESPGRPGESFIWAPDYSGRYTVFPDYNGIHLIFENGIHTPRDFSGDGNFQIENDKLVLKNLWLGTYKAKQKPDICEMTFKRSK